jgi:hypothetical protein
VTGWLVLLTLFEIALVIAVLVGYLVAIGRSLRRTAVLLGKVAFGVRAIETQSETIGRTVPAVNERLAGVSGALADLAALARSRSTAGPEAPGLSQHHAGEA